MSVQPFLSKSKKCSRYRGANHKKTISLFYVGDPANYALAFHWEQSDKSFMGAKGRLLLIVLTFASAVGFDSAFAQSWVMTSATNLNWRSVALSADGIRLIAAGNTGYDGDGQLHSSTNSGITWTNTRTLNFSTIFSVAASEDGQVLTVGVWSDGIGNLAGALEVSTNSGTDWFWGPGYGYWQSVTSSADGAKLAAACSRIRAENSIYTSTNSGVAWIRAAVPELAWNSVASSTDGTKLVASAYGQPIYISTNSGMTWQPSSAPALGWSAVASSADGRVLAAVGDGPIYTSTNWGNTWVSNSAPLLNWAAVAASADGSKLVSGVAGGPIFTSVDSGVYWISNEVPNLIWRAVASAADGNKLFAAAEGGGIYTWQTTPTPKLNITPSANGPLLSWIVPSTPFVLQENADLRTADWMDVPTQPTLNLSNLHHEVSVPLSETNRFYRLKIL